MDGKENGTHEDYSDFSLLERVDAGLLPEHLRIDDYARIWIGIEHPETAQIEKISTRLECACLSGKLTYTCANAIERPKSQYPCNPKMWRGRYPVRRYDSDNDEWFVDPAITYFEALISPDDFRTFFLSNPEWPLIRISPPSKLFFKAFSLGRTTSDGDSAQSLSPEVISLRCSDQKVDKVGQSAGGATHTRIRWVRANLKAQDLVKNEPDITLSKIYEDDFIRALWPKGKMPKFSYFEKRIGHIPGLKMGRRTGK